MDITYSDVASHEATQKNDTTTLSFIIPTLNEEKMIGGTVQQFAELKGHVDFEVIVADGGSTDRTLEIAEQHGAKTFVNSAEQQTIASNRNLGAKNARGQLLIFCDADTRIDQLKHFTTEVLKAFEDPKLIAAVPRLGVFPSERQWQDRLFSGVLNSCISLSFRTGMPFASGQCQIVRASSFSEVEGYNEQQVHGEDASLFQKLGQVGRLRYLSSLNVFESPRRYRKLGYLRLISIGLYSTFGQMLLNRNVLRAWERID